MRTHHIRHKSAKIRTKKGRQGLCVMSSHDNSSHRKQLNINKLHANVTSDKFLQKTFSANKDKKDWLKN